MSTTPSYLSHRLAVIALGALALLQLAWHGWLDPPTTLSRMAAVSFALIWFAPALLLARADAQHGLLAGALVALLYFTHGVMEAWANPSVRGLALTEIALAVIAIGCAGWPSWQQGMARRRLKKAAAEAEAAALAATAAADGSGPKPAD